MEESQEEILVEEKVFSGSTLVTKNLVKKYKQRTVVKGVSFDVRQGEIVGLLGPNGAGKTTTFYLSLIHI